LIALHEIIQFIQSETVRQLIMKNYNNNNNNNKNKNNGDENNGQKNVFRGPFPSSTAPNALIVNAITGVKYPWNVGSYNEEYLWKVADSTHFEPKLYYYDSPEQYEEYKRVRISPEAKFEWHRLQQRIGNASSD
jgi:hypothetical protein